MINRNLLLIILEAGKFIVTLMQVPLLHPHRERMEKALSPIHEIETSSFDHCC